jgi:hypothetical protein
MLKHYVAEVESVVAEDYKGWIYFNSNYQL